MSRDRDAEIVNEILSDLGFHRLAWSSARQEFLVTKEELKVIRKWKIGHNLEYVLNLNSDGNTGEILGLPYGLIDVYPPYPTTEQVMAETFFHG